MGGDPKTYGSTILRNPHSITKHVIRNICHQKNIMADEKNEAKEADEESKKNPRIGIGNETTVGINASSKRNHLDIVSRHYPIKVEIKKE